MTLRALRHRVRQLLLTDCLPPGDTSDCGPGPPACADAYTLAGSMTPALSRIQIANGAAGEQQLVVTPAPVFASDSPRKTIYLVSGPVTYLCDETQGTVHPIRFL